MVELRIELPERYLEGETRKGYYISPEMKKVWAVQMDLLNKLLEVCKKHNLKIWACGGTLIGVVREHGYIPWDDDIDMGMLRKDYDKLLSIASVEFTHPYCFQSGYTEKYYSKSLSKLRMDGTTAIEIDDDATKVNMHQGIFIDIFPYDAVPDDEVELEKQREDSYKMFLKIKQAGVFDASRPISSIFRVLKYRRNFAKLYGEYEDLFRKYRMEDCKKVGSLFFDFDTTRFVWDKHCFDEVLYMPFENMMLPVVSGYKELLTTQYGDYMTPVKAPSYHSGFWKLDAERSYKEYLPELKRSYRKERIKTYKRKIKKTVKKLLGKG